MASPEGPNTCLGKVCHNSSSLCSKVNKTLHLLDQPITSCVETYFHLLQEKTVELKDQVVDLSGTAVVSFLHQCRS